MNTIELMNYENYYLIALTNTNNEIFWFSICKDYNPKSIVQKWNEGLHFSTLEKALSYWNCKVLQKPSYERLHEILTSLINFMIEYEVNPSDYLESVCHLNSKEMNYFNLLEPKVDEDDEFC
jgi:glucose-6-phosphate 1-dehydrogenase